MLALLLTIAALAVIIGFAWSGGVLGTRAALLQLGSLIGASIAVLFAAPVIADLFALLPVSADVASLLAVIVVGALSWVAVRGIIEYVIAGLEDEQFERWPRKAAWVPAGLVGCVWVIAMAGVLVLMPSSGSVASAAIESVPGRATIVYGEPLLRWYNDQFPRFTQTLPKGETGARVTPVEGTLPLYGTGDLRDVPEDAAKLYGSLNHLRSEAEAGLFLWNRDVADVAQRHAEDMADQHIFRYTIGGDSLNDQLKGNFGTAYDSFGSQIAWGHDVATTYAALVNSAIASRRLTGKGVYEVGIGVVDAGWFNGRMYVICLVSRELTQSDGETTGDSADASTDEPPLEPLTDHGTDDGSDAAATDEEAVNDAVAADPLSGLPSN